MDEESVQFYQCIFRDLKKKKVLEEKMSLQNAVQRLSNNPEMFPQPSFVVYPKQLTTKPVVKNDISSCKGNVGRVHVSKSVDSCPKKQVAVEVPTAKSKSTSDLKLENISKRIPKQENSSSSKRKHDCEIKDEHDVGVRKEKPKCASNLQRDKSVGGVCPSSLETAGGGLVASKSESEGSIARVGKQHGGAEGKASSESKHESKEGCVGVPTQGGQCRTGEELSHTSHRDNPINGDKSGNTSKCKSPRRDNQKDVSVSKCEVNCNQETMKTDLKTRIKNICKKGKQSIMSSTSNHKSDKLETVAPKIKADVCDKVATDNGAPSVDKSICKKEKKVTASPSSHDTRKRLKDNGVSSRTKAHTSKDVESNCKALPTAKCVSKKVKKVSSSEHVSKTCNVDPISLDMKAVASHVDGQLDGGAGVSRDEVNTRNIAASPRKIKCDKSDGATDTTVADLCNGGKVVSRKERKTDDTSNNEDRLGNGKVDASSNPNTLSTPIGGNIDTSAKRSANKKERRHAVKSKSESSTCCKDKVDCTTNPNSDTLKNEGKVDSEDKGKRRRKEKVNASKSEGTLENNKIEVSNKSNSASTCLKEKLESSCSKVSKHIRKLNRKNATTSALADTNCQTEQLKDASSTISPTSCIKETLDVTHSHATKHVGKQNTKNTKPSTVADTSERGGLGVASSSSSGTICNKKSLDGTHAHASKHVEKQSTKNATSAVAGVDKCDELGVPSNSVTNCTDATLEDAFSQITNQINIRRRKAVSTSASEQTICTGDELRAAYSSRSATTCNNVILGDACSKVTETPIRKNRKSVSTSATERAICRPTDDELRAASNSSSATTCNNVILGDECSKVTQHHTRKSRKAASTSASEQTICTGDELRAASNSSSTTTCNNVILGDECSKVAQHHTRKSRKAASTSASEQTLCTGDELRAASNSSSTTTCNNVILGDECSKVAQHHTRKSRKAASTSAIENTISIGAASNSSSATTCNNVILGDECSKPATRTSRKVVSASASENTVSAGNGLVTESNSSSPTTCNNDILGDASSRITKTPSRKIKKVVSTSASEYTTSVGAASNSSIATTFNNDILGDASSRVTKNPARKIKKAVDTSESEYTISVGAASNSSSATTCNIGILRDADKVTTNPTSKSRKTVSASTSEYTICLEASSNSSSAATCNKEILGDTSSKVTKNSTRKIMNTASEYRICAGDELGVASNSSSATTCNKEILGDACSRISKHTTSKSKRVAFTFASECTMETNDDVGAESASSSSTAFNNVKLESSLSKPGKHGNKVTRKDSATLARESSSDVVGSTSNLSSAANRNERKSESVSRSASKEICKKQTSLNISIPRSIGVRYQEQLRRPIVSKSDGHCDQKTQVTTVCASKSSGACAVGQPDSEGVKGSTWSLPGSEYEPRKERTKYLSNSSSSRACFGDNSSSSTTVPGSTRSAGHGLRAAKSCGELSGGWRGGVRRDGVYADKFRSVLATVKELEESVAQSHREEDLFLIRTAHLQEINALLEQQVVMSSSTTFKDKNKRLKRRLRHRRIQYENLRSLLRLREDHLCDCMDEVSRLKSHLLERERTISRVCEMFLKLKAKKDEQVSRAERLEAELDDVTSMFALLQATPSERVELNESEENLLLEQVKKNSRLTLENSRLRKHLSSLSRATDPPSSDATPLDLNN